MRAFTSQLLACSGRMSGSTVVTSSALLIPNVNTYSIHAVIASSPGTTDYVTGTFKLQCSNDLEGKGNFRSTNDHVVNWVDITGASQVAIVSGSGGVYFNANDAGYTWVRLHYTNTAGSGSFEARATGKMTA